MPKSDSGNYKSKPVSETGRPAGLEKAKRLNARAAEDLEFWNWVIGLSKRELAEIILALASRKAAYAAYRRLKAEKRI